MPRSLDRDLQGGKGCVAEAPRHDDVASHRLQPQRNGRRALAGKGSCCMPKPSDPQHGGKPLRSRELASPPVNSGDSRGGRPCLNCLCRQGASCKILAWVPNVPLAWYRPGHYAASMRLGTRGHDPSSTATPPHTRLPGRLGRQLPGAFPKSNRARLRGAESDTNPNLTRRNRSESEPGPSKPIRIRTRPVKTDPNPNLAGTRPIRIRTHENQSISESGACEPRTVAAIRVKHIGHYQS